ncbi:hypothetical protein P691DRAFT_709352 [Macrolepiota fuliginosa MF-IS2]|uniref:CST complex subunit Stn1 N-terminal domain-containing protein n=1 Tax=Macrolepiota fuliginosa MF-IS2 TaxID=1400762 RepID=A0A9P5X964_9AGAR|nr:hypothetical protein P691DRAFT_709352 [Macrolepiota fuliginosa MF-IS2]
MSRNITATMTERKPLQRAGSILLSPSKRGRLSEDGEGKPTQELPAKEIWEWTLTSAAVAKCYIRDAVTMPESQEGYDFYWLGSVPCRKVEICGLVVGLQVFEKKILYTVDDGTSVIDCVHISQQHSRLQQANKSVRLPSPPPPPKPIARIGGVLKAVGKIQRKYENRVMLIDEIFPVISTPGSQLDHWRVVRERHKTHYSRTGPFVIPIVDQPRTPTMFPLNTVPTPSTVVSVSSPVAALSSPIRPNPEPQSPPRLRHPSRLRSHNLTDTAFRLYVKHFIDNAPEDSTKDESNSDDDVDIYPPQRRYTSQILSTPTKPRRYDHDEHTPRTQADETPKPGSSELQSSINSCKGFTLSYLRRIPELSLMAKRVVKQRAREEDKKARNVIAQSSSKSSSGQPTKRAKLDRIGLATKKKRLFQWAICELLRDGSIVLWDGPKRPCREENTYGNANASMLWRYNSSTTSDGTLFSNASISNSTLDDGDELELSDPEPDEEAYASTKPELLIPSITGALKVLASAPRGQVVKRNELIGGSTKDEILGCLRRDDRWAFIGEWNVAEALDFMEKEGLAWRIGPDKWLLTQ